MVNTLESFCYHVTPNSAYPELKFEFPELNFEFPVRMRPERRYVI